MKRRLISFAVLFLLAALLCTCGSRPAPIGSTVSPGKNGVIILHGTPTPGEPQNPAQADDPDPVLTDDPEPTPTDDPEPTPTDDPEPTPTDDPDPVPTDDPDPVLTDDPDPFESTTPSGTGYDAEPPQDDPPEAHTHSFGEWISELPATCSATGTKAHAHCRICNKDFDADGNEIADLTIPMSEHTVIIDPAVLPTCVSAGLTEGSHCAVCNKVLVAQTEIPATEHAFGNWIAEIPATCSETGTMGHFVCPDCNGCFDENKNKINDLTIPCIDHRYENGKCTLCGKYKESTGLRFQTNGNGTCALYNQGGCWDSTVVIPSVSPAGDSVIGICKYAFLNSTCLAVVLPKSVTEIAAEAFYNCPDLAEIVYLGTVEEWNAVQKAADWKVGPSIKITCKDGILQA